MEASKPEEVRLGLVLVIAVAVCLIAGALMPEMKKARPRDRGGLNSWDAWGVENYQEP